MFTKKMQKKLVVLFFLILSAFMVLSARLIWITSENKEEYKKQVLSQQMYDSTTIAFRRGDIIDAKGSSLAASEKIYNLVIDAKVMLYREAYLEPTLKALAKNFELDITAIREYVKNNPNSSWYTPLRRLTYEEISGFIEAEAADGNIKGVWFEEEYRRVYPYGSLACDVIGFVASDNKGTFGLEEYYNDILNGTTGRVYGYLNNDSNLERTVKPAVDGYTIQSTMDITIQGIVEKYLKKYNDEHKDEVRKGNGAENVGCIIMDVITGGILAMASYPVFDLNDPRDLSAYYTEEEVARMKDEDTYVTTLNELWRNYCIFNTYEPGSTFKPFTVAIGLESGKLAGNEVYYCGGGTRFDNVENPVRCHNRSGDGYVTVQDAVAWSCNVALMSMAETIGKNTFTKCQGTFNFGLRTNIDLVGEGRTAGLLHMPETMQPIELATNSFGQGFNATMIQMITGYASLINGGYYYEPHMVSKVTNSSGATVRNIEPRVLKQTVSSSTSELIRQYTRACVMEEGGARRTGHSARPAGYAIGGKTGTAQTLPRGNGEYVVSFIGHAPADNPRIAVYVVVDRPNVQQQDKASLATGIVRNVLTEVLPYLGIFMTEELSEREIQELRERELEITSMYARTPENEALDGLGQGENEGSPNEEGNAPGAPWMSYKTDPATGYLIDPENGELIDPATGDYVNLSFPAIM
jgi:stage V sporulation protein D (sporulation-specific penicillin-binding protein)